MNRFQANSVSDTRKRAPPAAAAGIPTFTDQATMVAMAAT